jgi:predicted CXXCH cytochrome family protein
MERRVLHSWTLGGCAVDVVSARKFLAARTKWYGLFVLLIVTGLAAFSPAAQQDPEHPFIESKDLKSETCLTCHPDKNQGKFVHTAVGMGCENCHQASSENGKTTITLVATGGDLCTMCHEMSKDPVLHGPYQEKQCEACHDPHASDFPAHTRLAANALCMECHANRQISGNKVQLAGPVSIPAAEFEKAPKIALDANQQYGHPWAGHPVGGIADPLHKGEKMSCLSCHTPHASQQAELILAGKPNSDICDRCHQAVQKQKDALARLKDEQLSSQQAARAKTKTDGKRP